MDKTLLKALQKIFVWVPASVKDFNGATVSANSQQIYFEASTGAIYVNGVKFGLDSAAAADISNLKAILSGFGANEADPNKTVLAALTNLKSTILGDATDKGDTLGKVEDRVEAIETLIGSEEGDADGIINKLREVIDWFANVNETETGAALISNVAANKAAIGTKNTAEDGQPSNATGLYKEIEDVAAAASGAIDALHVNETTVGAGNVQVTYKEEKGIVTISGVAVTETEATYTAAGVDTPANLTAASETALLKGSSVAAIKSYVDAKVADADEAVKIAADSTNFAAISETDDHEISIKTSDLSSVGIEKVDGKWQVSTANVGTGLAVAADVAKEIAQDEAVIAAALNDHEDRILNLENIELWSVYTA